MASIAVLRVPELKEGGHTRLRVRGVGPNSDDWRKSLAVGGTNCHLEKLKDDFSYMPLQIILLLPFLGSLLGG